MKTFRELVNEASEGLWANIMQDKMVGPYYQRGHGHDLYKISQIIKKLGVYYDKEYDLSKEEIEKYVDKVIDYARKMKPMRYNKGPNIIKDIRDAI